MSERHVVKVQFLDHAELQDEKLEDIKKAMPIRCTVYGEVIAEGEDHITVLSCYQDESEDTESQNHSMLILKKAITSITELTPKGEKSHV